MSGGSSAILAAAVVASTVISYRNGQDAKQAQSAAQQQAQANALKQERAADQAMNQANQKKPDTAAILSAAQQSGKAGASGTMLTGPAGIDPNSLTLGKSTLLGG